MSEKVSQGDLLKIRRIKYPVFVVSKDFFNASGEVVGCPIYSVSTESPLHVFISADEMEGYVQCEKLALLDLKARGYQKVGRLALKDTINIIDAVQGIFDYI